MKIVAFVDALGFKNKITSIKHEEAISIIKNFNSEIYNLWKRQKLDINDKINGHTFSDSLIVYTENDSNESFKMILDFLVELYKISITKVDLPLRGGISIGDFDNIPAQNFNNLQKGIVIGNAFIDAYSLESLSKIKGSKIVYRHNIHLKIEKKLDRYISKILTKTDNGEQIYEIKWGDIEFLTDSNYKALNKFVELATESQWIDHYYHTLETFLTKETQTDKHQIFRKILEILQNKSKFKYNDIDNFIGNFSKLGVDSNLKRSFLAYIRENLK